VPGLGYEASGIVDELGPGVTKVAIGDRVFGATPAAAETAARALDLLGGSTLFINGASGSAAVQLAIERGLRVIDSCSAGSAEWVRTLGAEPVVYGPG
jgi:NADPH:quinone reductase-like Zn-dependent oxidoreductase